jgi:rRNA-processing protein FCF1
METDRVRSNRIAVIFDTNFILSCLKFGISFEDLGYVIEKNFEILVPSNVIYELKNLDLNKKDSILRNIALKLIDKYKTLELRGNVDSSILSFTEKKKCIVCTNDRELRRALRKKGVSVIFIRNRKYLELDGTIF